MTAEELPAGSVGRRLRAARKLAGFSQRQLADRAHVSVSLVRKVEQGDKPASPAFVAAAARALRVLPNDLTGQPYPPGSHGDREVHAVIPALRRELVVYRVPPDGSVRPRPFDQLQVAVADASRLRHAVSLTTLGVELPGLLEELRAAAHQVEGVERERLFGLLAETYYAADQVASKLGYVDLASMAVDRYEWAAAQSGDPLAVLVGDYRRAGELIANADWIAAQRLLECSRAQLEPDLGGASAPVWSTWGNLHLKSGLAAARAGDAATSDAHLAAAREAANRTGERDDYRLAFGPTNVAIWGVGLAVERQDGTEAVTRAADVHFAPGTPTERIGHHWIDLADGYLLHGDRERSLEALNTARRIAPQQTRHHPKVHETVAALAHRDYRKTGSLAGFARWANIRLEV